MKENRVGRRKSARKGQKVSSTPQGRKGELLMLRRWSSGVFSAACLVLFFAAAPAQAQGPVKIGIVQGFSGALEAYAKQMLTGFKLGLEYGTKGKN
jgi:hypothetical protein